MKAMKTGMLLLILTVGIVAESTAQVVVRVRPARPRTAVVVHIPPSPSPRHVWVAEDWRPRGRGYVWSGGYYVVPPHPRAAWIPGHWVNRHRGWVWIPGRWRR